MEKYQMVVSKKGDDGKYVPVGSVDVFYPLLEELGFGVKPEKWEAQDKDGKTIVVEAGSDNAMPVYADEKVQFVFESVWAAVKAMARNRLMPQSATLKDGLKIAETIEELLEAGGGRSGEALAIRREFFKSFKDFLGTLGKSAAYVAGMYDIASNVKGLPLQSKARKDAVLGLVEKYISTTSADLVAKYQKTLDSIVEGCKAADPLDELV